MSDVTGGYRPGQPCWYTLTAPDLAAAEEFYRAVLGWEFEPSGPGHERALAGGRTVAAIRSEPGGAAAWTTYLATDDVTATLENVRSAGGTVVMEPRSAGAGMFALVADPTGGVFGLWQGESFAGSQAVNEPGAPCWAEASSTDTRAAGAFFAAVFGLEAAQPWQGYNYTQLKSAGEPVAGILGHTHENRPKKGPTAWLVYFQVEDAATAAHAATDHGGTVLEDAQKTPFGTMAIITDPAGARLVVIDR